MKKTITTLLFILVCILGLSAQELACNDNKTVVTTLPSYYQMSQSYSTSTVMAMPKLHLKTPEQQMKIGRNLLISGGCLLGAGIIAFPLGPVCFFDSDFAGVFTIGGITLMGASVPLFIAGSVMYVKGKKASLAFNGNGLTLNF